MIIIYLFSIFIKDTPSESIIDDIFEAWAEFKVEEQEIKEKREEKEAKGIIKFLFRILCLNFYKSYNILLFTRV